jgi:DNA-binding beta-propeller fold protein YncE
MPVARWGAARLAVGAILAVVALAAIPAAASADFTMSKAFGPNGTNATNFIEVSSVAADVEAEVIYVLDGNGNALYKFDLEGNPVTFGGSSPNLSGNKLSGLATGEANPGERQVAVNPVTHVVYLTGEQLEGRPKAIQAFQANGEPSGFSATGTNKITGFFSLEGVSVDEDGAIYTSDGGLAGKRGEIYDTSGGLLLSSIGGGELANPAGSAVDSSGNLYVLNQAIHPRRFTPSEFPVTSATTYSLSPDFVDPNQAHGLAVDRETDNVYVTEFSPKPRIAVFDSEGAPQGTFGGPGESGELKGPQGLAAITSEGRALIYIADTSAGESKVKIFEEKICECAPEIESTSASEVTGDSATLRAKINPFDRDTSYWFEYGLEDCAVGPCEKVGGLIPAQKKPVQVQLKLSGLAPGTTYYFRAVADNGIEEEGTPLKFGPSATFTTQASGLGAALSDSRAWEMVSPPKKLGGVVFVNDSTTIQASSSGEELAYASNGSLFSRPASNRAPEPATVLAARDSGGGWANRELTPLHTEASTFVHGQSEFKLFTPDLDQAVMEPSEDTPLSPEADERTPYLWSDGAPPSFTPLLTPANVPPGTETNPEPSKPNRVRIAGVSPGLSVVAVMSIPPLIAGAATESVYTWSNGTLEAVSELPAAEGGAVVKGTVGTGEGSVRQAISEDGSRVFWTSYSGEGGLYLRDRSVGESWRLDLKQGGSGLGGVAPAFSGASADGSVVYFTDSERLTADASAAGRDLYRCEIGAVEGGGLGCATLTDLSVPLEGSGESAEVIDQLPAISEDGSRLFFVARGVLDEEQNEAEDEAASGEPNLYYWEEGQSPRFVARLSKEDRLVWGEKLSRGLAVDISAAISPDGRYFTFTSGQSLTGYENRNSADQPNTEVFLYDTEAEGDRLSCISCNPSGASAVGEKLPAQARNFPPDPGGLWEERWVAATLPQATQTESAGPSLRRPRAVLDNGRVFFNAVDPLVAADSNGEWDVYQYQPIGTGSCTANTATATATRSGAGCVGLLSSGSAAGDAGFLDASQSGNDVFFLTKTKLSVLDQDEELDVYDARVNGIPAVLHPVSECAGEACQPSVGPPNDPTPASESFNGAQTPLVCPKGKKKAKKQGREVCVAKKKNKKHKKKKPAHKSGRAGR